MIRPVPVTVRVQCRQPSAYESARRHGGSCGWTIYADSAAETTRLLKAHVAEKHPPCHALIGTTRRFCGLDANHEGPCEVTT